MVREACGDGVSLTVTLPQSAEEAEGRSGVRVSCGLREPGSFVEETKEVGEA